MPRLPLEITFGRRSLKVTGIVDSAASVNVLPYRVGLALGAVWEDQVPAGALAGSFKNAESRALPVLAKIPEQSDAVGIPLLFAWAESDNMSVLLGQTNFLMEFNVCFYRSKNYFEVWRV